MSIEKREELNTIKTVSILQETKPTKKHLKRQMKLLTN
jgi:hypothetical protein